MSDRSNGANERKNRLAAALRRNLGERRLQKARRPAQAQDAVVSGEQPLPDSSDEERSLQTVGMTSAQRCQSDNAATGAATSFERG